MMTTLARQLLDRYQRGLPLSANPYAEIAAELGVSEQDVLATLRQLREQKIITRVGPVFDHHKAGASTLVAMAVPPERLDEIAAYISRFDAVNHNYAREHDFNLWFVVTAADQQQLDAVLATIETDCGMPLLNLPMEQAYHIDLGFKLAWQD
jgi:DNA-binding Lrp family transcriptional regulator